MLNLTVKEFEKGIVVRIEGDFHIGNVKKFGNLWKVLIDKNHQIIALDCSKLDYLDSSAIGTLIEFHNTAINKKKMPLLFDLNNTTKTLFEKTRLHNFFTIVTKTNLEANYLNTAC